MRLVTISACCSLAAALNAADTWPDALQRMPLIPATTHLNRTNCVEVLLRSFQSNTTVKALVFMPGATDEFYMFRRAEAHITAAHPTLFDAVSALTNQTIIRAAFRPPFLLLHTTEDVLDPQILINHQGTADRLRVRRFATPFFANDRDWDFVQPIARDCLHVDIRPWRYSRDSWHFYRHSLAAFDLDGWEGLQALSLAGKSRFTVDRSRVTFEPNLRTGVAPGFDSESRMSPAGESVKAKSQATGL